MKNKSAICLLFFLLSFGAAASAGESGGVVNVNSASVEQLAFLPEIGPVLAARIRAASDAQPLAMFSDLVVIKGIGVKTIKTLEPFVIFTGSTTATSKIKISK